MWNDTRKCEECFRGFIPNSATQVTCSEECQMKRKLNMNKSYKNQGSRKTKIYVEKIMREMIEPQVKREMEIKEFQEENKKN